MCSQVSRAAIPETDRRSADFHPSIWGDYFLCYASQETDEKMKQQVEELKEKVRKMLTAPAEKSSKKLNFIDAIQRLGVSYHFRDEIQEILQQLHETICDSDDHHGDEDDLHTVALRFRLLRQQGYYISSAIDFTKFKDRNGNFNESLINDAQGMLSLYEAAHLRVHGEDILDEALVFTTTHLESIVSQLSSPLATQVSHALKQPIRKGISRLEASHYFSIYQEDASHNKVLLTFAKLDFNLLQKLHQKEISDITRWWKDLNISRELPFIRDRVVELYFWMLAIYFEPEYLLTREILTKVIVMISVIDDIHDVYGTLEELELFNEAIKRWDISAMDQLPEYMKVCYRALLGICSEMDQKMGEGRSYSVKYSREAIKNQVKAYFEEAKWFHQKYIPTFDEYMDIAIPSSAHPLLATTSLVGMESNITKDSFEWLIGDRKIVRASAVIGRLMNDIVSHKFEQKRGHVSSAVECYMIQYGATEEEAIEELQKQITDAWKDINEECLYPTTVSMPLVMPILNLTRAGHVIYKDGDNYTHSGTLFKDIITTLLIHPMPL